MMTEPDIDVVAECKRCGSRFLISATEPDSLTGICLNCQDDSDVERPLTFTRQAE